MTQGRVLEPEDQGFWIEGSRVGSPAAASQAACPPASPEVAFPRLLPHGVQLERQLSVSISAHTVVIRSRVRACPE